MRRLPEEKKEHAEISPHFRFTRLHTVWNFNWDDSFVFNGETHISWEIVYVVSGCVCVTEDEKLYKLREGDMIIHAPMEFHTIQSAENTNPNVYVITSIVEGELPKNLTEGVFGLTQEEQKEYMEIYSRVFDFFDSDERDALEGQGCTDALSAFLIKINKSHTAEQKLLLSHSAMEYKRVVLSMTEHIYDNLTLEELAAINKTSVSNIKALFKRHSGTSPMLHYSRLRCTEAIRLMSEGYSAAETANALNFSSPNYFSTFFKRMTGKPPVAFIRGSSQVEFI
ncbi:MAG: helix-turn-helix domain-containing protein [Ruminococcaceae bacterium]|nr:helix-turn-helix domain-containing protein [Oscillospiraceae bacterium]